MEMQLRELIKSLSKEDFSTRLKELVRENLTEEANEIIRIRCEDDFETFCELLFPHYITFPFNKFHRDCFSFFRANKRDTRRVDCAPRGYAKSSVKTFFKPLHDLCYGLEKYILFVSATKTQSVQKLKDIRSEILTNDLLHSIYGVHFPNKRPGTENFEVNTQYGEVYLHAIGAGTEARGIRYRESRPSKIILDDVEDSEEILNEELREKTKDWFFEVISKLGTNGTNIEVVGTILHRDSLLKKLEKNPIYNTKIYKAVESWASRQDLWEEWRKLILDLENEDRLADSRAYYDKNEADMLLDAKVLWPEKEPYLKLMEERVEIGERAFMKEKQNQPLPSDEALFDQIWWYREDPNRGGFIIEKSGAFIPYKDMYAYGAMDPATGDSKTKNKNKLDFTCICCGYKDLKGRLFVHTDWTKRARPTKYIEALFNINDSMNLEKFAIETNLYRNLLIENIVRERKRLEAERKRSGMKDWGIKVPFYDIDNRDKKEKRIFTLEPKINNGWILFNRTLGMEFMEMIENFPSKDVHDDGPDALEMLWGLINNRYKPSPMNIDTLGSR